MLCGLATSSHLGVITGTPMLTRRTYWPVTTCALMNEKEIEFVGCCFLMAAWQIDVLFWPRDSGWGVMWWETSERDPNPERVECRWLQLPPALFTSHPFAVTKMALTGQILNPTLLFKQKPQLWSWNMVMGRSPLPVDRYVHSTGVLAFFFSTPECSFHIWKIHTGRKFTKMLITFVC